MLNISQIAKIVNAESSLSNETTSITELVYDSRKIVEPAKSLFFALQANRDGHQFIQSAYDKGVRNFVISDPNFDQERFQDAIFLRVEDTLKAMQLLAKFHRNRLKMPVIGITGSNGKTVVKEWLTELLSEDHKVYQSPKSYNSQLGVALSLWNISDDFDLAIIEAGISLPGEMQRLESMLTPDIGIFTHLGDAHAIGFKDKIQKFGEKIKLFQNSKTVIIPAEYIEFAPDLLLKKAFTWGDSLESKVQILSTGPLDRATLVTLRQDDIEFRLSVPFVDEASIDNVLTCVSVLRYLGIAWESIARRILRLKPVEMRLQLKAGIHQTSIIDDSYSNDLGSLRIALDFLDQQRQHDKKTIIITELPGFSDQSASHQKIWRLLSSYPLNRVIWIGRRWDVSVPAGIEWLFFEDVEQLFKQWDSLTFSNESILVKGGRQYHLERVVERLTAKSHGTVLEINLNALRHNIMVYRSLISKEVKLMAMVKAFSYGSGSFEIANLLQYHQVDYLTVAFVDEGVELRQGGITIPIMVLSPDESTFEKLVEYQLEPEIYSFSILKKFIEHLKRKEAIAYPIHIKLDTGMHRLGFLPDEVEKLIEILKDCKEIRIMSVFSHLVASGNPEERAFTLHQIGVYDGFSKKIIDNFDYPIFRHLANTSAITNYPEAHFDMVRLGIGLYGISTGSRNLGLQQVGVLKTTVTQLKKLQAGDTVGYDRKGKILKDSTIATVKIGYADGYSRAFGNGVGMMKFLCGEAPTIGNICMDMTMLDVTGLNVGEGDEVLVYPEIVHSASAINTIAYELLVNISSRVKRVYFYE